MKTSCFRFPLIAAALGGILVAFALPAAAQPATGVGRQLPVDPEGSDPLTTPNSDVAPNLPTTTTTTTTAVTIAAPVTSPAVAVIAAPHEEADNRPSNFSIGVGVGYSFPADLRSVNVTSIRFRLPSGLMFEPGITLQKNSQTQSQGPIEVNASRTTISANALVHYPLRQRDNVDLNLLGGAALRFENQDPDGASNNLSTTTASLVYGIALNYWVRPHWTISLVATNGIVAYTASEQEDPINPSLKQSSFGVGAIWNPAVAAMLHLHL